MSTHPDRQHPEHHESIHCPETGLHCYDPKCGKEHCERKHRGHKKSSEELYDELMEKLEANIFHQKPPIINVYNNTENIFITEEEHHHRKHPQKPILALLTLINQTQFIMADITLTKGVTPKDGVFTLLDSVTGAVMTGVTFSGQTVGTNSNPTAATFALDPADATNNSVLPTPLAAGTGTIAFSTSATYTDSAGTTQTNVPFSIVKNFTVLLGADGVTFDVVF